MRIPVLLPHFSSFKSTFRRSLRSSALAFELCDASSLHGASSCSQVLDSRFVMNTDRTISHTNPPPFLRSFSFTFLSNFEFSPCPFFLSSLVYCSFDTDTASHPEQATYGRNSQPTNARSGTPKPQTRSRRIGRDIRIGGSHRVIIKRLLLLLCPCPCRFRWAEI